MSLETYLDHLLNLNRTPQMFSFWDQERWVSIGGRLVYQLNPSFFRLRPFAIQLKQMHSDLESFVRNNAVAQHPEKLGQLKRMLEGKVVRYHNINSSLLNKIKKLIHAWLFGNIDHLKACINEKIDALSRRNTPLSAGKKRAIDDYMQDPKNCTRNHKRMLFMDINAVSSLTQDHRLTSVESYARHFCGNDTIDLRHPLCSQFIQDCFKELDIEATVRLVEWLLLQPTFHPDLWAASLEHLLAKEKTGAPINYFSMEELLFFGERNPRFARFPLVLQALTSLINHDPNNNRIFTLVANAMDHFEFTFESFGPWLAIFQEREKRFAEKRNLFYPLLDRIIEKIRQHGEDHVVGQPWDHAVIAFALKKMEHAAKAK